MERVPVLVWRGDGRPSRSSWHIAARRRAHPRTRSRRSRGARELGADGVELDARRTADDVLVVHHDPEIEGFGLIAAHPFAALRAGAIPTSRRCSKCLQSAAGCSSTSRSSACRGSPTPTAPTVRSCARSSAAVRARRARCDRVVVRPRTRSTRAARSRPSSRRVADQRPGRRDRVARSRPRTVTRGCTPTGAAALSDRRGRHRRRPRPRATRRRVDGRRPGRDPHARRGRRRRDRHERSRRRARRSRVTRARRSSGRRARS